MVFLYEFFLDLKKYVRILYQIFKQIRQMKQRFVGNVSRAPYDLPHLILCLSRILQEIQTGDGEILGQFINFPTWFSDFKQNLNVKEHYYSTYLLFQLIFRLLNSSISILKRQSNIALPHNFQTQHSIELSVIPKKIS